MEKEMRELYIEGVATRDGPELCAGVREGVGEALTGVRAQCRFLEIIWVLFRGMTGATREAKAARERLPDRISIGVLSRAFPAPVLDEVIEAVGVRETRYRRLPVAAQRAAE
jgi:hypothetical protein